EDVEALSVIAHCGTAVLASAHGSVLADLARRPLYLPLLRQQIFLTVIRIQRVKGRRSYAVEEMPCST
ncbi:MAG: stage III sporulation protein AB, partial [Candidatus Onthomonas sp.]|nr:stage III sporulation protein AB [Candidatus Onthomonas sp.]